MFTFKLGLNYPIHGGPKKSANLVGTKYVKTQKHMGGGVYKTKGGGGKKKKKNFLEEGQKGWVEVQKNIMGKNKKKRQKMQRGWGNKPL